MYLTNGSKSQYATLELDCGKQIKVQKIKYRHALLLSFYAWFKPHKVTRTALALSLVDDDGNRLFSLRERDVTRRFSMKEHSILLAFVLEYSFPGFLRART